MNDHDLEESPIRAGIAPPPPVSAERTISAERRSADTTSENELQSRLQSRFAVLLVLFIATGALGIPLLWINRRFSTSERIFWTFAVSLYTIGVLVLGGVILVWMWNRTLGAIYS